MYLLVSMQNLLIHLAEKSLLSKALKSGGFTPTSAHVRQNVKLLSKIPNPFFSEISA